MMSQAMYELELKIMDERIRQLKEINARHERRELEELERLSGKKPQKYRSIDDPGEYGRCPVGVAEARQSTNMDIFRRQHTIIWYAKMQQMLA